jgi:hypothetical protein
VIVLISAENDDTKHGITLTIPRFCPGIVVAATDGTDAEMIENWVAGIVTLVLCPLPVLCPKPLEDTNAVDVDNLEM